MYKIKMKIIKLNFKIKIIHKHIRKEILSKGLRWETRIDENTEGKTNAQSIYLGNKKFLFNIIYTKTKKDGTKNIDKKEK